MLSNLAMLASQVLLTHNPHADAGVMKAAEDNWSSVQASFRDNTCVTPYFSLASSRATTVDLKIDIFPYLAKIQPRTLSSVPVPYLVYI